MLSPVPMDTRLFLLLSILKNSTRFRLIALSVRVISTLFISTIRKIVVAIGHPSALSVILLIEMERVSNDVRRFSLLWS